MASPLIGIAGVNSLLFAAYGTSKRIISPFPNLSLKQIALAGSMAGAANAILASPGSCILPDLPSSIPNADYEKSRCSKYACKDNMVPTQTSDSKSS
jgi:hypothetical protein